MRSAFPCRRPVAALCLTAALAAGLGGCQSGAGRGAGNNPTVVDGEFKVLVYSRTQGFRHASIEAGQLAISELGQANDFAVDYSEDPSSFTSENLSQYAALIFLNTTLDVLDTEEQKTALVDYMAAGGGYVGVHSAADTHHDWDFYGQLVGAQFLSHPVVNQPGSLIVEDLEHPSTAHLGETWSLPFEEYYSFDRNPREDVRVLLRIDEDSYDQAPNTSCDPSRDTFPQGYSGQMGDHPMAWCHDNLGGRAWYTALGHEIYLYQDADYREHLLQGILIAARRQAANCSVAPPPADLPAYQPPELQACENQILP